MSLVVSENGFSYDSNLPKAIVMYRYEATEDEEISLEEGCYIDIVEEASDGWWRGFTISKDRKEGIFPFNYVRKLSKNETETWKQKMLNINTTGGASTTNSILNNIKNNSNNIDQAQQSTLRDSSTSNSSSSTLSVNHNQNQSESTTSLPGLEPTETHYIASLSDPIEKEQQQQPNNNQQQQQQQPQLSYAQKRLTSLPPVPPQPTPLQIPQQQSSSPSSSTTSINSSSPTSPTSPQSTSQSSFENSPIPSLPTPPQNLVTIKLDDVSKEGYLTKKGHIRRNWNVRWFRLKRNVLTYTKSPSESKVSGELILTPDTQVDIATSMKRTNCFQIRIPNHMNTKSELILACSANSPTDMEEWINAINQAKLVKLSIYRQQQQHIIIIIILLFFYSISSILKGFI
ncbi:pleckstrin domain-containing protein [Heterostelium album PN500]|uniref:Pleckstrin domain-containing protein n=1 Tax=Heterostelium pallidum (strain ATCC 26659 / Pp 5 / PN500) TaxID=670386 RepID=D3B292_HETP5|nr:pleckstrin domain-containing protein [Heterostelium album PN500]EFA84467.1 pleckstrin domain-containing protein [Heterostelium album PN500]|eukprot:XP_020436581.1 pleckstrin domain-containing protein [Heterostelium album PN500]